MPSLFFISRLKKNIKMKPWRRVGTPFDSILDINTLPTVSAREPLPERNT